MVRGLPSEAFPLQEHGRNAPVQSARLISSIGKGRTATGKAGLCSLAVPNVHQAGGKQAGKWAARLGGLCGVCA